MLEISQGSVGLAAFCVVFLVHDTRHAVGALCIFCAWDRADAVDIEACLVAKIVLAVVVVAARRAHVVALAHTALLARGLPVAPAGIRTLPVEKTRLRGGTVSRAARLGLIAVAVAIPALVGAAEAGFDSRAGVGLENAVAGAVWNLRAHSHALGIGTADLIIVSAHGVTTTRTNATVVGAGGASLTGLTGAIAADRAAGAAISRTGGAVLTGFATAIVTNGTATTTILWAALTGFPSVTAAIGAGRWAAAAVLRTAIAGFGATAVPIATDRVGADITIRGTVVTGFGGLAAAVATLGQVTGAAIVRAGRAGFGTIAGEIAAGCKSARSTIRRTGDTRLPGGADSVAAVSPRPGDTAAADHGRDTDQRNHRQPFSNRRNAACRCVPSGTSGIVCRLRFHSISSSYELSCASCAGSAPRVIY
ncbi:MAG: hypothetical protein A2341_20715 [Deltaproteobacteria bacterium RIFOXYB12_FULL_58_9]|nr:MAG: hypothetical protein A2341_20715 [Deltaproteobacteria bacterium RIFOXYB12_FULL_58_9]